ncbi:hypothetical protein [Amycolatopsis sp. WGS_07]|uniref:hypothetical protein n=1 Tax=Amycolatopsis sp. WGS_07 TaxID=3076764 RepID=UPI003873A607
MRSSTGFARGRGFVGADKMLRCGLEPGTLVERLAVDSELPGGAGPSRRPGAAGRRGPVGAVVSEIALRKANMLSRNERMADVMNRPGVYGIYTLGQLLGYVEAKTGGSAYNATQQAKDAYLQATYGFIINVVRNAP